MVSLARGGAVLALLPALGCGGIGGRTTDEATARRLATELIPPLERSVGLTFRRPVVVALRSREQVAAYLRRRLAEELPPGEMTAVQRAYRAFGLLPDTLDLFRHLVGLYTEQVAGYYDPDSAVLYVVRGVDRAQLRLVLAHELVHALQDQYLPLAAMLRQRRQNDRRMASHAVAEGQATLASLAALNPGADLRPGPGFWQSFREGVRRQQGAMPVFASAPRIIREGLVFPYLAGADFMQAFAEIRAGDSEQPYGERMPVSTEQILHPDRYAGADRPRRLRLGAAEPAYRVATVYDDDFGEFETRVLLEEHGLSESEAARAAAGWNGDRYWLLDTPEGEVVLWASAWDTPADAEEFRAALEGAWRTYRGLRPDSVAAAGAKGPGGPGGPGRPGGRTAAGATASAAAGRRFAIDVLSVDGVPVVRLVDAPPRWSRWGALPALRALH